MWWLKVFTRIASECPLLHGSIAFLEIARWQFNTFWHKELDFYDIYMILYHMISHTIIIGIYNYIYIKTNIWYHVMLYCSFLKCTVLYTCVHQQVSLHLVQSPLGLPASRWSQLTPGRRWSTMTLDHHDQRLGVGSLGLPMSRDPWITGKNCKT